MIDAGRVVEITKKCLTNDTSRVDFENEVYPENLNVIKGVMHIFPFEKKKLECYEDEVKEMLLTLPILKNIPLPFISLCYDKKNNLWTGEHMTMESLFALGCAFGFIEINRTRLHLELPYISGKEKLFI